MNWTDGPFQIRSCPGHGFYAGHFPNGNQALVGLCIHGYIFLVVFDRGGTMLKVIPAIPGR